LRITERIHMVTDAEETVNAIFLATEWGTIVVDTMRTPSDGELLKEHVNANTAKPIRLVINTHFHADHTFGNVAFSAPRVATEKTRRLMQQHLQDRWREIADEEMSMPLPDITFGGELDIHTSSQTIQLREVGGHAPGTLTVFIPEDSIICTSDLVFAGRLPFMADADLPQWIELLKDLEQKDIEHVIPGHGRPGSKDLITEQRTWLEEFCREAREVMRAAPDLDAAAEKMARSVDAPADRVDMLRTTLANLADER